MPELPTDFSLCILSKKPPSLCLDWLCFPSSYPDILGPPLQGKAVSIHLLETCSQVPPSLWFILMTWFCPTSFPTFCWLGQFLTGKWAISWPSHQIPAPSWTIVGSIWITNHNPSLPVLTCLPLQWPSPQFHLICPGPSPGFEMLPHTLKSYYLSIPPLLTASFPLVLLLSYLYELCMPPSPPVLLLHVLASLLLWFCLRLEI